MTRRRLAPLALALAVALVASACHLVLGLDDPTLASTDAAVDAPALADGSLVDSSWPDATTDADVADADIGPDADVAADAELAPDACVAANRCQGGNVVDGCTGRILMTCGPLTPCCERHGVCMVLC